jgi:polyphosphate kinase
MTESATVDEAKGAGSPAAAARPSQVPAPAGSALFINRELSWLEFNQRVLDEAEDASVPLLERLKFLAICAANLDEFFMVRVAGLIEQVRDDVQDVPADGMTPRDQLAAIARRTQRMVSEMATVLNERILPDLAAQGVRLVAPTQLSPTEQELVREYFREQVLPILTPLAIDPGHPFPHVRNRSLNLVAMLSGSSKDDAQRAFAVVQVPSVLPRLVRVPTDEEGVRAKFVRLESVIAMHFGALFPGFRFLGAWPFRVVRNFDLSIDEEEAEDLIELVGEEVRRRDRGNAVRLTVETTAAPEALEMLERSLGVDEEHVFKVDGPLAIPDLAAMAEPLADRRDLRDEAFMAPVPPPMRDADDIFEVIAREDVLLHHPYESFDPVVEFISQAAADPKVLAIKQTLYRTSGDSPIVKALMRAAENGKQVAALVEIKARFDEENNIQFARRLENSGVHVVYGLLGLKTHCKAALVVRREGTVLRRYVHLGTGNYNPSTARLYTDVSFFSARPELGEDATALFNLLTSCTAPSQWRKLTVAPLGLHERILGLIEREAAFARAGKPARIIAKMNALVDPDAIHMLYRASQAGVQIDLIVRGICCLRPGLPGVSENIRVRSVVDRFLEHSRLFYFEAGGEGELYGSSADWMPRNFVRRVEVLFPIEDPRLKRRVVDEILAVCLADDRKASMLLPDGSYRRVVHEGAGTGCRSQERYMHISRENARRADARARRERPFIVRPIRNRPTKSEAEPPPDQ